MGPLVAALVLLLLAGCAGRDQSPAGGRRPGASSDAAARVEITVWDFEADAPGAPPAGFTPARTGPGRDGRWEVRALPDAPAGGRIVAQLDDDTTSARYALLVADERECADLRLSVRCRPLSGLVDQAVGLVFRLRDADTYYLTRANALEGNVRLYRVKAGRREQIASWDGPIAAGAWHTLAVEARGERLSVSWNGQRVIAITDAILRQPGRVGLWTKADSLSEFDDLSLEVLDR